MSLLLIVFNVGCARTNDLDSMAAYIDFLQRAVADRSAKNDRKKLSGLVIQNPQCLGAAHCSHRQHIHIRKHSMAAVVHTPH